MVSLDEIDEVLHTIYSNFCTLSFLSHRKREYNSALGGNKMDAMTRNIDINN